MKPETVHLDQPANPRIRTKINNLDRRIDLPLFDLLAQLRQGDLDIQRFQKKLLSNFNTLAQDGAFRLAAAQTGPNRQSAWLLKRHIDHRRYSVLCYFVDHGEVHPPHHHHNVASTQIVLEGKLHLREFDRVKRDGSGKLHLRLVTDKVIGPGESFQASEWSRNVHWFSAVEGPARIFNINVRGFEPDTFETDESRFGRLYVDPTHFQRDGLIVTEEFDEREAIRRFQGKPLSAFPVPPPVAQSLAENRT